MSYLRDTVIILKNEPFREHDAWVTMYGREHGKLIAVARGARRPDAKSIGHLEPLSEVQVMIAKGATFDKLAVASVIHVRPYVREHLSTISIAAAFAHTVDLLTHPGASDEEIFFVFQDLLNLADNRSSSLTLARSQLILSAAYLKLLDCLGYAPTVDLPLLQFMRARPVRDLLNVTAPAELFFRVSTAVDEFLKQAPFRIEPHGRATVAAMLS